MYNNKKVTLIFFFGSKNYKSIVELVQKTFLNLIILIAKYREKNNDRVPILVVLTDKMPPDNSTLDFPLRMPIYIPNFGRRGLSKNLIM